MTIGLTVYPAVCSNPTMSTGSQDYKLVVEDITRVNMLVSLLQYAIMDRCLEKHDPPEWQQSIS